MLKGEANFHDGIFLGVAGSILIVLQVDPSPESIANISAVAGGQAPSQVPSNSIPGQSGYVRLRPATDSHSRGNAAFGSPPDSSREIFEKPDRRPIGN